MDLYLLYSYLSRCGYLVMRLVHVHCQLQWDNICLIITTLAEAHSTLRLLPASS